jgi:hypothetical protein
MKGRSIQPLTNILNTFILVPGVPSGQPVLYVSVPNLVT